MAIIFRKLSVHHRILVLLIEVVKNAVRSVINYLNWLSRGILLERVLSTPRLNLSEYDFLVYFHDVHYNVDFC